MIAVKDEVLSLVTKELREANKVNPLFHSSHEGYAVILEENDEANLEMAAMEQGINTLWQAIKENNNPYAIKVTEITKRAAINLACEAIQVAAMCEKLLNFYGETE